MRFLFACSLFLLWSFTGVTQRPTATSSYTSRSENRINKIKIARLTDDMKLSKAQAEKFWPVYNEFDQKRIQINREIRQLSQSITEDDNPYKKQETIQRLKQQRLDLVKIYKPSFLKIISEKQYGIMITSEDRFNQELLERLKERNRDGGEPWD